ncbi:MAG: hypothetical protein KDA52_05160 [Planctomycetaceae bacterium]|nr:hypothetical protein [Planctomycetaceae bacterium]
MIHSRLKSQLIVVALLFCLSACSDDPQPGVGTVNTPNANFDSVATPDAAPADDEPAISEETAGEESADPLIAEANDLEAQAKSGDPESDVENAPPSDEPIAELRSTTEGRWELVIHMFESELTAMLVDIQKTDDGYQLETVAESPVGWTVNESTVTEDELHLKIVDSQGLEVDYQGQLHDGVIRGNIAFSQEGLDLASLRATTLETIDPESARKQAAGYEQIADMQPGENLLPNMRDVAKSLGDLPLAYELYVRLFNFVRNQPPADWDYSELVDEYVAAGQQWGERVQARVDLDVAYTLAITEKIPEIALEHLDKAEQELSDIDSEVLASRMTLTRGLLLINSESEEDQQSGYSFLEQIKEKDPLNLVTVVKMAKYQEDQGSTEEAIKLYAGLVTIPGIRGDISKIANMWKELGRDPQELDPYLDEIYEQTVFGFLESDVVEDAAAVENQQVVLGELFTGTACPPCVAADIAIGGLERTYPLSKLIVLRYHEHVPAPDPMMIADGETRLRFYEAPGTPSFYLNGTPVQGVGGAIFNAKPLYQQLSNIVKPLLEQTTDLSIKLSAEGQGETLHIAATVEGAEEPPESWRLRLCLVEESVHYHAPNGIRIHEMLVRYMPGGAEGILPRDDGFAYEADITATDIHQTLQATIDDARERYQVDLPAVSGDLDSLKLVAFVQDDLSLEIKQAASIPITGFDATAPVDESTAEAEEAEETPAEIPPSDSEENSTDAPESSDSSTETDSEAEAATEK